MEHMLHMLHLYVAYVAYVAYVGAIFNPYVAVCNLYVICMQLVCNSVCNLYVTCMCNWRKDPCELEKGAM